MYERKSDLDANLFGPEMFGFIAGAAAVSATAHAQQSPQLRQLFGGPRATVVMGAQDKSPDDYLAAASVLESVHLTRRQQQVTRLVLGLTVVSDSKLTNKAMVQMLGTRPGTVLVATSTLTAKKDQYTPRGLRFGYREPLLTEAVTPEGDRYYQPAEALEWCLAEPGRYPAIDEATFEAAELLETLANDSW